MWTKKINVKKVTSRGTQKKFDQLLIEKKSKLYIKSKFDRNLFHTQVNEKELIKGYIISTYKKLPTNIKYNKVIDTDESKIEILESSKIKFNLEKINYRLHDTIVFNLTSQFQEKSILFKDTAISESAALVTPNKIISFSEDINGYNAFYKVLGLLNEKNLTKINEYILMVSFKIDFELIKKCKELGIHTIISRTAPTAAAYDFAVKEGIKLIGFARGTKYNIYT